MRFPQGDWSNSRFCTRAWTSPKVARQLGLTEAEVIALRAGTSYRIYAISFFLVFRMQAISRRPSRAATEGGAQAESACRIRRDRGVGKPGSIPPFARRLAPDRSAHHFGSSTSTSAHFPIRAEDQIRFEPIDALEYAARQGELLDSRHRVRLISMPTSAKAFRTMRRSWRG